MDHGAALPTLARTIQLWAWTDIWREWVLECQKVLGGRGCRGSVGVQQDPSLSCGAPSLACQWPLGLQDCLVPCALLSESRWISNLEDSLGSPVTWG